MLNKVIGNVKRDAYNGIRIGDIITNRHDEKGEVLEVDDNYLLAEFYKDNKKFNDYENVQYCNVVLPVENRTELIDFHSEAKMESSKEVVPKMQILIATEINKIFGTDKLPVFLSEDKSKLTILVNQGTNRVERESLTNAYRISVEKINLNK